MSTCTHLEIDSMILVSALSKVYGLIQVLNAAVNSHNFFVNELRHGFGHVNHVTSTIQENERQTVGSDAEHAHPFWLMFRTCRDQTKQVIISRRDEVNP